MVAALATLAACGEHRYAALGAMGELGSYADAAHRAVGQRAAASGLALLIVLGVDADGIAEGAREGGMPIERILRLPADEAGLDAAAGMLGDRAASGDTILVKASRAAQLERLVTRLASTFGTERP
jgi:UDP-N-acetylmuramoyl-tripeptide--D-alanyl-D-alanine ligase